MKARERFLNLYPSTSLNFLNDSLENLYQKDQDLTVDALNELSDIQNQSNSIELNYCNEFRINKIIKSIIETTTNEEISYLHSKFYLGIVNKFELDVSSIKCSEDTYLVVMKIGFYSFLDIHSEIVSRIVLRETLSLPKILFFKRKKIIKKINEDILVGKRKINNYIHYFKTNEDLFSKEKEYFKYYGEKYTKESLDIIGTKTRIAMTTFVILHEIAHHVLNHTNPNYFKKTSYIPEELKFWEKSNKYNENQKEEFEADSFAIHYILSLDKFHPNETIIKFPEIEIYAICALLALNSISTIDDSKPDDLHPPVIERIKNVIDIIKYYLPEEKFNAIVYIFNAIKFD